MNIQKTKGRSVTRVLPERTWTLLPARPRDPDREFIYFMYSAGRIKIGYTCGTQVRHRTLAASGAFPPAIILVMHGTIKNEHALHSRFQKDRLHGEWFSISDEIRDYLHRRLCDIGRATLDRAEVEYHKACQVFTANFRYPPHRRERVHCEHGMPLALHCAPCERERDLKIMASLDEQVPA